MKTYPAKWPEVQISYFAGMISAHALVDRGVSMTILQHASHDSAMTSSQAGATAREICFSEFLKNIEHLISQRDWDDLIAFCERIFA